MAGVPIYIVHLSSADALEKVRQARDMGLPAYAETCPQYLFLSYDNYEEPGFDGAKYVMSPPLREKWHQDVLWKGLAKNDLQVISTDHCPFCMNEQKELGKDDFSKIPNGAPGIETRLTLVHNGGVRQDRISLNRFVELCSTAPAKMFGLFPRKGTIAVGSDADIVVFDPELQQSLGVKTLHMRVDYNPYEGTQVTGAPRIVIANGKVIIEGGAFVGKKGAGRFIKRGPSLAPVGSVNTTGMEPQALNGDVVNQLELPDGRVELRDTRRIQTSPLYNDDLAPVPIGRRELDDLQLRRAVDQHGALHPYLHARVGTHRGRHELVAGAGHGPPRQHHRPRPDPAQLTSGHEVRHPLPGLRARRLRNDRIESAGADAGPGRLRLVRHPGVDRRRGAEHVLHQRHSRLGDAARPGGRRPSDQ